MTSKTWGAGTVIDSAWLQDVNNFVYNVNAYPSIQAAVTALGSNGGKIYFPYQASGYTLGTLNVNQSNIEFDFGGNTVTGTIKIVPQSLVTSGRETGTDYPLSWKNGATPLPMDGDFDTMMYENTDNLRVKNIVIRNMRQADSAVAIKAFSVDGLKVYDSDLQPVGQSAIRVFHSTDVIVENNTIGGSGTYAIFFYKSARWTVRDNKFISTTVQRHCSAKGALHQPGKTIFQGIDANYVYKTASLFTSNRIVGGIDGVFWDTTPNYTEDAVGARGGTPIGFTSGNWFGAGGGMQIIDNPLINLANGVPASGQCRGVWVSAPHRDVTVANNFLIDCNIFSSAVPGFVAKDNVIRFSAASQYAIFTASDTPSSTTNTKFTIAGNVIHNFDAVGGGFFTAISIAGLDGIVSNNIGHLLGATATDLIALNATTDEVILEGNKLYRNGGTQVVLNSGVQNANGKKFNNDTLDTNTHVLVSDGYVEGTFTPTLSGATTAGAGTYTVRVGRYTRVGNRCFFNINMTWTAHTGTGTMIITGFPFSTDNTANNNSTVSVWSDNLTFGAGTLSGYFATGSTTFTPTLLVSGGASNAISMDVTGSIIMTGSYEIND